jgi:hypothetical protein
MRLYWNAACDPGAEDYYDQSTTPDEICHSGRITDETGDAIVRSESAASRRAAIILGLCPECWEALTLDTRECTNPYCSEGPEGGLEP